MDELAEDDDGDLDSAGADPAALEHVDGVHAVHVGLLSRVVALPTLGIRRAAHISAST